MNTKVAFMSTMTTRGFTVERLATGDVRIGLGELAVYVDMETVRDFCNDMAEVLDAWYEEADRRGRSASDGRDTNVSLPDERDRNGTA